MSDEETLQETDQVPASISWWKRALITLCVCVIAGSYPVMTILSHKVTNDIPDTVPNQVWDDRKIGAAIELLERENFFGLAAAAPDWHPKSRLTAMPAFQRGISDVISAFAASRASVGTEEEQDSDLKHATTLLNELNGKDSSNRLHAAIEALRRFHGRKARNLIEDSDPVDLLKRDLALFASLIEDIQSQQTSTAAQSTRGVFNREIVSEYYHAKGQLHAMAVLLKATRVESYAIPGFSRAFQELNTAFERAARPAPMTVSNPQPGDFSLGGNDIMQQAFLTSEAADRLVNLRKLLEDSPVS